MSANPLDEILNKTPRELGYTFPPEWHPHQATWLSWPRPEGISFPGRYEMIPPQMGAIIREVAPREQVHINVPDLSVEQQVRRELQACRCSLENVFFHHIPTNEPWCRDHGPAFVLRQSPGGTVEKAVVDWGFNAWGGKYPPFDSDDAVPTRVAEQLGLPVFYPLLPGARASRGGDHPECVIMEGGSVDFNGLGTLLTTEQCLLNPNRNAGLNRHQIEQYLRDFYGQSHICWLGEGIAGDDTDGHVDDLARFVNASTIVVGVEEDPRDQNYKILKENLERARLLRCQDGEKFEVVEIPMPGVVQHQGQRLPATYVNFYFVNGALLVPTYRHPENDQKALDILQRLLPERKVIGIDCVDLIWGLGAIHCLTQQQPAPG